MGPGDLGSVRVAARRTYRGFQVATGNAELGAEVGLDEEAHPERGNRDYSPVAGAPL